MRDRDHVLVLQEDEAFGKKSKLSRRVATVVQELVPEYQTAETDATELYRLRSECLHEGLAQSIASSIIYLKIAEDNEKEKLQLIQKTKAKLKVLLTEVRNL